ncbi:MFS transporter [Brevibacillus ruminantium]|uniref:MFS transporter n=2 Tax=Brevibacillus ruminantium TaxID=2950604 RepID=A0ABY4WMG3_9BACL|nr:MFS transporter [Brevibacillus ruminantium]
MTLGNSMLIPILPTLQTKLGVSSFQISMIITVYSAVAIVLIPLAGYLSDQFGRKKVIVPSLIITALGGLISGVSAMMFQDSYWLILLGRMLQGAGAAGSAPIVLPLIGDMFYREEEVSSGLGVIETANTFGKVLSPILGAFLATFLWYLPFLAIPVFSAISILLVLFLLKSPKQQTPKKFGVFLHDVREIFKQKGKWLLAVFTLGGICMFVLFGVLFYLSTTLEEKYGIDGVVKGLLLAIPLGALCIASYLTGKFIGDKKKLMKWLTFTGLLFAALAVFLAGYVATLSFLILILVAAGVGIGASLPCLDAFITAGIEKEQRGTISSLYSSMRFIGVAAGPPVVSVLMGGSPFVLFGLLAGLTLLGAIVGLFAIRPKTNGKEEGRESMKQLIWRDLFKGKPRNKAR